MRFEDKLVKLFDKMTVLRLKDVTKTIGCSHDVLGRFLKRHGFYSSSNKNGAYYILAKECKFDENGLFFYGDIMFSKYRTLKHSILSFVERSDSGVSSADVRDVFGINSAPTLSNLYTGEKISRQMYSGTFYYFSADTEIGLHQRESRKLSEANKTDGTQRKEEEAPSPQISVAVLTASAVRTGANAKQIKESLKKQGLDIPTSEIKRVLKFYSIPEKKTRDFDDTP